MTWQTKDLLNPAWNSGGGKGGGVTEMREKVLGTQSLRRPQHLPSL